MENKHHLYFLAGLLLFISILFFTVPEFFSSGFSYQGGTPQKAEPKKRTIVYPPYDKLIYDAKLLELANNPPPPASPPATQPQTPAKSNLWPVKTAYPNAGAILPFKRVVAYYGNLYSKKMGALGEYPEDEMLSRLVAEVKKWNAADPKTPVLPALHYIAVVAQASPGERGLYRLRMPGSEIEKVLKMAEKIEGIVFLDIQVGLSNLQAELPALEKYLKLPQVHLGIDPEFSIKTNSRPGKIIGTYDAADINFAAQYLAKLVQENNLPPKIFVVHRFTQNMVTNYKLIKPLPEVQIVMDMDGWGPKAKKIGTYKSFIYPEPVQFTGFKLFYKNDTLELGSILFAPEELLKLRPKPIYVQYQ